MVEAKVFWALALDSLRFHVCAAACAALPAHRHGSELELRESLHIDIGATIMCAHVCVRCFQHLATYTFVLVVRVTRRTRRIDALSRHTVLFFWGGGGFVCMYVCLFVCVCSFACWTPNDGRSGVPFSSGNFELCVGRCLCQSAFRTCCLTGEQVNRAQKSFCL